MDKIIVSIKLNPKDNVSISKEEVLNPLVGLVNGILRLRRRTKS